MRTGFEASRTVQYEAIDSLAAEVGFDLWGVCDSNSYPEMEQIREWIARGFHAGLDYMAKTVKLRADPCKVFPFARSILIFGAPYFTKIQQRPPFARYSWGRDYHKVIKKRLKIIAGFLRQMGGTTRVFVDTSPIMEKVLAQKAGLGFLGYNGCIINPKYGSFFFIGGIATDLIIHHTGSHKQLDSAGSCRSHHLLCSDCGRCLQACPTGALLGNGLLDCRKCLSFWSIESRDGIPEALADKAQLVFGCDVCQEVCPYNCNIPSTRIPDFEQLNPLVSTPPKYLFEMQEQDFLRLSSGTVIRRIGYEGFMRNLKAWKKHRR